MSGRGMRQAGADSSALLLTSAENGVELTVSPASGSPWRLEIASDPDLPRDTDLESLLLAPASFALLASAYRECNELEDGNQL